MQPSPAGAAANASNTWLATGGLRKPHVPRLAGELPLVSACYGRFTPVRFCEAPTTTFAFSASNVEPTAVPFASTV